MLAVRDIERSAAYFRDILGFEIQWQEAADWRLAKRDGVRVMLGSCRRDAPATELGSHDWFGYIDVTDVASFYTQINDSGAMCSPPVDRPYGMREIVVTTVDGHRIVFGQDIATSNKS